MADARARHELEHRVEHAEPGAQHRHDDDVRDPARRPGAGPSGVSTVTLVDGRSLSASATSSTLMRVAARRKCSGVVVLSRSVASASCTSG